MDVSFVFMIAGTVILIGFLGSLSFEKTKIPDVLLLLGIGILLGPLLRFVNPEDMTGFADYFGSLALMIILFEGGLNMDMEKLLKEFATATSLVVMTFFLSAVSITIFLCYFAGWSNMQSLLLGTILACTSSAIVMPVVQKMSVKEETKIIVSMESAFSDVLSVVLTISIIEFIHLKTVGIKAPFRAVAGSFSVAIVSGVFAGFFWLKVLDLFREKKYSYMTTLAAILMLYSAAEFLGGSGPIAVLIFGVFLGNRYKFVKSLKLRIYTSIDETIRFLHSEIAFFIRTFFFVYMGMMLSPNVLRSEYMTVTASIVLLIVLTRYISVGAIGVMFHKKKSERFILLSMLPRGLASAVLATLPLHAGISGTEGFIDYTFLIIVFTNVLMTFGVFAVERKRQAGKEKS